MKVLALCLVIGVALSGVSGHIVKRAAGGNLFASGKEYVYKYSSVVVAGSHDYVSFGSAFNITGELHVAVTGNHLDVKLTDLKLGVNNGEYQAYGEEFDLKAYDELTPLTEPFQVNVEDGHIVDATFAGGIPEWARNIQRGIANALQVDMKAVGEIKTPHATEIEEQSILGECHTYYQVVPQDETHVQIRKYRSHEDCKDAPIQVRKPNVYYHNCADGVTRDVLNSSTNANYDVERDGGEWIPKKIQVHSTLAYHVFGAKGHEQYSYASTRLDLITRNNGGSIAAPSNPKKFNDIKFVFEHHDDPSEDLKVPTPFYFHDEAISPAVQDAAIAKLKEAIDTFIASFRTTGVFKDLKEFHRVNPLSVIKHVGVLDYDHLKQIYEELKADAEPLKNKLFLDSLVLTGTGPAALVLRDVIAETQDPIIIMRLFSTFVSYIRNPTEQLVKEYEGLLQPVNADRLKKVNGRMIDLAFASLVGRACKKDGCKTSGLLAKYVKYFSDRFDSATGFEEQTAAVGALRNIGIGAAAAKLREIVENNKIDDSVRVQAIPGLKYLKYKNPKAIKEILLPIFYDRREHAEIRSVAAKYLMVYSFEPELANQMVMYMWSEKCSLVKNYLYTLLSSIAGSTRTCIQDKASYARTMLSYFPPWTPNPKYSANYLSDYYDKDFGFGQMTDYVVHKSGSTMLPTAAYVNFNGAIAGFGNSYATLFVRLEGAGKAIFNRIMTMSTQITKFEDINEVFAKIGVIKRQGTPLKVELGVMLQNRVIAYHALDSKFQKEVPALIQKVATRLQKSYDVDLLRTTMLGGAMTERPNELGFPVSTFSSVYAVWNLKAKVDRSKQGESLTQEAHIRIQGNLFGISGVSNHFKPLGAIFSVTAHRTARLRAPRDVTLSIDVAGLSLNAVSNIPTEDDPAVAMFHATAVTSVVPDVQSRYGNNKIEALVGNAKTLAVITKGDDWRDNRQVGFLYKYLTGVKGGLKYFDCEKVHNRAYVVKQLRKIFGPENKNDGGRIISRLRLGLSYLRESLFFSPITETCGMKAYFYQDPTQETVFKRIEGVAKAKYAADPGKKLGVKVQVKSTLKFVYEGAKPKTRQFDLTAVFQSTGLYKKDTRVRLAANDEITGKTGLVCIEVKTENSRPNDWFAYEGPNEPTQDRTITITYANEIKDATSCPDENTSPRITYARKSHRSAWQKEEAKSDRWPYKNCKADQASGKYPGSLLPATENCVWAAFYQTKLREANITVDYRVDAEARQRWRKPGAVLAAILMPYWVPEESADKVDDHAHHHGIVENGLIQGQIKLDADFSLKNPHLDIHFHGSEGQHEHYHNIDLDVLPVRLLNPVSTRFDPLQYAMFRLGVYAYCDVTTGAVQTFDNSTYYADISECKTLLSADCSATPRYAVYGKKIAADKIAITVQIAGHKIELSDVNKAIVDGTEVALSEEIYTVGDKKIFKLFKMDENNVFLASRSIGVYVRYTGHYTTITAGSRYRETNCGVCGNFNGNKYDDFTGPDPTCTNLKPQDMFKAYVVRDGNCEGVGSSCPATTA